MTFEEANGNDIYAFKQTYAISQCSKCSMEAHCQFSDYKVADKCDEPTVITKCRYFKEEA